MTTPVWIVPRSGEWKERCFPLGDASSLPDENAVNEAVRRMAARYGFDPDRADVIWSPVTTQPYTGCTAWHRVTGIDTVVVDIDEPLPTEAVLARLRERDLLRHVEQVVASGRGHHVYFRIVPHVRPDGVSEAKWNELKRKLTYWLRVFTAMLGGDPAVARFPQHLRYPGSVNSKYGTVVETVWINPDPEPLIPDYSDCPKKEKRYDNREVYVEKTKFNRIAHLAERHGVPTGYRNNVIFTVALVDKGLDIDVEECIARCVTLSDTCFEQPLDPTEIAATVRSAYRHDYAFVPEEARARLPFDVPDHVMKQVFRDMAGRKPKEERPRFVSGLHVAFEICADLLFRDWTTSAEIARSRNLSYHRVRNARRRYIDPIIGKPARRGNRWKYDRDHLIEALRHLYVAIRENRKYLSLTWHVIHRTVTARPAEVPVEETMARAASALSLVRDFLARGHVSRSDFERLDRLLHRAA